MIANDGTILDGPLTQRMIGISGSQLRRVPEVVAVAGGADKSGAVAAVLAAGFVTSLITNASVARLLLGAGLPDGGRRA